MHLALWLQSSLAGSPAGFVLGRLFTSLVMCAFPIYKVSLFVLAPCTSQSLLLPSKCPDGQKNVVLHLVFATLRELSQSQTTTSFFGGRTLRRNLGKGDGEISSHHLPPKKVSSDALPSMHLCGNNRVVKQPRSRAPMVPCSSLVRGLAKNFEVSRFPPRYISPLEDGGLDLISLPASYSTPKVCLQTASELTCYEG